MEKMRFRVVLMMIVFISISYLLYGQGIANITTTIDEVMANPGGYISTIQTINGLVDSYIYDDNGSYYIFKSDYGNPIRVLSEDKPETNRKYTVKAFVYVDKQNNMVMLIEKARWSIDKLECQYCGKKFNTEEELDNHLVSIHKVTCPKCGAVFYSQNELEYHIKTEHPTKWWLYAIVGLLIIILIIILILQKLQKKKNEEITDTGGGEIISTDSGAETIKTTADSDFQTIKFAPQIPDTMVFIPGKLEIISEVDTGKSFRIAGYPSPKGNIVTIGRESVSGDRQYSHIQINKKFGTVSRKQAEIREKDGKIYIKNLSNINLTQLNGRELAEGEMPELQIDDIIRTGELEFKYSK